MIIKRFFQSQVFIFLLLFAIGGCGNLLLRHENVWDWINYHYYNVWALFHHRLGYDLAPASVATYFNPLIDIPYYLMMKYWNNYPYLINFFQGTYLGVLLFVVFKISRLFFSKTKDIIFTILLSVTGFSVFSQWGISSNEIAVSIFILWGIYLILYCLKYQNFHKKKWIIAGLLMGMGMGFKLTAVISCFACGITLIVCAKKIHIPWHIIIIFALAGLIGYLMINGWLMVKLYHLFSNPFFPFLNTVFKSEYFENYNFSDDSFVRAENLIHKLFLPFIILLDSRYVSEKEFLDFRMALVWIIFVFSLVVFCFKRKNTMPISPENMFLCVFLLLFYLIWVNYFLIIRYAVVFETLSAIVIVRFFLKNMHYNNKIADIFVAAVKIFFIILLLSVPVCSQSWGVLEDNSARVSLEKINLPKDAYIKLYGFPIAMPAALIVGEQKNRIIAYSPRGYINGLDFMEKGKLLQERRILEQQSTKNDIYLVASNWYGTEDILVNAKAYNLYCRSLRFNLFEDLYICVPARLKEQILEE